MHTYQRRIIGKKVEIRKSGRRIRKSNGMNMIKIYYVHV